MPKMFYRTAVFLRGPACRAVFFLMVVILFSACLPAFGLWLPWATEEQKVKKTLDDVWKALIANDQIVLRQSLTGTSVKPFIDQEKQKIKHFDIRSYDCKIKSVKIDPTTKAWAFVEYEAVAKMGDGKKLPMGSVAVLQKIGGQWKFLTGVKTQMMANQESKDKKSAKVTDKTGSQSPESSGNLPAQQLR